MSRKVKILLLVVIGVWILFLVVYLYPKLLSPTSGVSSPAKPPRVRKLPDSRVWSEEEVERLLIPATPVDLKINFTPIKLGGETRVNRILLETKNELQGYRFLGFSRRDNEVVGFFEKGGKTVEVPVGGKIDSYILYHVSELGALLFHLEEHKMYVVR